MMTKSAKVKCVFAAVLTILMIVVILQNTEPVETTFLLVHVKMPQIILLLITLIVGAVAGIIAAELWAGKKKG